MNIDWNVRLGEIDRQLAKLKIVIRLLWILFWACLSYIFWRHYVGIISLSDLGGLLQGTIGILATVISVLYLLRGIFGTEKQIALASQQAQMQAADVRAREIAIGFERERQKIERALEGRLALVGKEHAAGDSVEAAAGYAQALLRQCRPYLGESNSRESLVGTTSEVIPRNVLTDRYVNHLKLVFNMAAISDKDSGSNRLVDHIWHSLTVEERALAVMLIACGEPIPKPSSDALSGWEIAVEPYLPWNGRRVPAREFLE
jgi:hypothetical protein